MATRSRRAPARRRKASPTGTRRRATKAPTRSRSHGARRGAAASRATRSRRGRAEFGVGLASSWKRANYAYPGGVGKDRGKRPSYPITPRHVRGALTYSARSNTAGSASHVRYALRRRYGSVAKALAAARRAGH